VLEAPWSLLAALFECPGRMSPDAASLAIFAVLGVAARLVFPKPWTAPLGVLAGLAWALCSCADMVARV